MELEKQNLAYTIKRSMRARKMRIAVYSDSSVVLTLPFGLDFSLAESFFKEKLNWVVKSLQYFSGPKNFSRRRLTPRLSRRDYIEHRSRALALAKEKVLQWNKYYNFSFNRVSVKNQKTRWGSCSKKANLNFNYKIVYLPLELLDYLIVHELCHLKEFNHSKNFWTLVGQAIPNYKVLRSQLKKWEPQA